MAAKFDIEEFVADFEENPSEEKIFGLKRIELFDFAKYNKISVTASMKKADLRAVIIEHLVDEEVLEQSVDRKSDDVGSIEAAIQLKKLELEIQLEQTKKVQLEIQLAQMKKSESASHSSDLSAKRFDPTKFIKLVPPFLEKEVDKYFAHFEKVADRLDWPKELRTLLLQSVLVGKAREVYSTLPLDKCTDYDVVKAAILKAYELVPEAYRQQFRERKKQDHETYVEFANEKKIKFDRWCRSRDVGHDFDKLKQLVLLEDFKWCVPQTVRVHLEEQRVTDLDEASVLSDDYVLTHKQNFQRSNDTNVQKKNAPNSPHRKWHNGHKAKPPTDPSHKEAGTAKEHGTIKAAFDSSKTIVCAHCKRKGHTKSNCFALQRQTAEHSDSKPIAFTNKMQTDLHCDRSCKDGSLSNIREEFLPFVTKGFVSLNEHDNSCAYPVTILRDTASTQSLMLQGKVPLAKGSSLNTSVCITGIGNESFDVPLHRVYLKSALVSGPITVGVTPSLPKGLKGITLLLGNEVAGSRVVAEPCMTDLPGLDDNTKLLEKEFPGIFPACVTTRSMSRTKQESDLKGTDVDISLSDSFMARLPDSADSVDDEIDTKSLESEDVVLNELGVYSDIFLSRDQLISEQGKDKGLAGLIQRAFGEEEARTLPVCFFMKSGVLMRKWRPPDVPSDNEWKVLYQIVVPTSYRSHILSLAHDIPLAGHLGVAKTCNRILQHFYWPGVRQSVSQYCRTCHTCQVVGKPNQKPAPAPLKPIPAFEEPFSRVLVDCVGPLPKTKSGHEYLLTIMCASTRYAEAIPLRSIKAKPVGEALRAFFTRFGLPKEVQSDQGSNFTSRLFQEELYALGIRQVTSSAYHPQSQGALERFHQTLKSMIRTYCEDHKRDWDEGIPLLLFAVREVVQESLGFSPFELVFGRSVRGPLKLVKEKLLSEKTDESVLSYITQLKERLKEACELAHAKLKATQQGMKLWYDKKCKDRSFSPGDKVLVLLPVSGQPLSARYRGPYTVESKVGELDYVIATPDRRKSKRVCHVNMLKQYHDRQNGKVKPQGTICATAGRRADVAPKTQENNEEENSKVPAYMKLKNSELLSSLDDKLSHLTLEHKSDMSQLIRDFTHLFPDVPGKTDVIFHDIDVGESSPIKQHPYRAGPAKQAHLNEELKYMKENGIIEESESEWSSPCILVPKPDCSFRFCTDFRKVNSVTKSDTYPLPRVDDCIDHVGKAKFVSTFDLLKGYWQVPLTPRAKEVSAFVTPQGLYQYKVLPFGLKNAPASFQRLMNNVLKGMTNVEVYIDDIIVYNDTWKEHMESVRALFNRLSEAKLTVNLAKSQLGKAKVKFLGHIIGQGVVEPAKAKVEAVINFPKPTTKKEVMRFLGIAGYYRKFCKNFSDVIAPLTSLLNKKAKFVWSDECNSSFEFVKSMLANEPILMAPDFSKPFKLAVDASDIGIGSVLIQEDDQSIDHPICYFSKKLNKHQLNYSTIEKECLALVLSLQHFEVYLSTTVKPTVVYTDHNPLVFLYRMRNQNRRLQRWSLILQEFNIEIRHIKGKDNFIADALSRM